MIGRIIFAIREILSLVRETRETFEPERPPLPAKDVRHQQEQIRKSVEASRAAAARRSGK